MSSLSSNMLHNKHMWTASRATFLVSSPPKQTKTLLVNLKNIQQSKMTLHVDGMLQAADSAACNLQASICMACCTLKSDAAYCLLVQAVTAYCISSPATCAELLLCGWCNAVAAALRDDSCRCCCNSWLCTATSVQPAG